MNTYSVFFLIIGITFILTLLIGIRDRRREERKKLRQLEEGFGCKGKKEMPDGRYDQLPGYLEGHRRSFHLDDITWRDLDMDALYRDIDTTCSNIGEEYLYYLLRSPALKQEEILLGEDQISYWRSEGGKKDLRLQAQRTLQRYGQTGKYSIYMYLSVLKNLPDRTVIADLPAILLPAASFVVLFLNRPAGAVCLLGSIFLNIFTYFRGKQRILPYLETMRSILRILACADRLSSLLKEAESIFDKELQAMREGAAAFSSFRRGAHILLRESDQSGNPVDILMDYVCIMFHLDLFKFGSMLRELKKKDLPLDSVITAIGRIDVSIATASYREALKVWTVPVFTEGDNPEFDAEGLYHPLLSDPVPNDFRTETPILITGSNASGKSTFLKASALCAVMGQTLRTVPASAYRSACFRIYTSMALKDSILDGESYFIVEIRSLRRIIDAAKEGGECGEVPVFCCIDEVLRGTNTVERISASVEILRLLSKEGILVFAATHDLELTGLLKDVYENYHFSEEIEGDDVVFSYQIMKGEATTRNAIRLLRVMGYDKDLADRAEERARAFLETGAWSN